MVVENISNEVGSTIQKTISQKRENNSHDKHVEDKVRGRKNERGSWIYEADKAELISILDNLPYGVTILGSPFGNVRFINKQIVATLGYTLPDTPSTAVMAKKAIPDRKERAAIRKAWKQIVKDGGGALAYRYLCEDGMVRTFEQRAVVLRKNLIVNTWIDVTRREEAEDNLRRSESRFRSFFERSTDPFCLLDGNVLVSCNDAVARLFNCESKEELIGTTLDSLSPDRQPSGRLSSGAVKALLGLVRKQGNCKTEWTISRSDGVTIPVELSIAAIELKAKALLFAVLRDITPWKQAQEVLLHANADLEASVKERTADLTAANRRLRREIETRKKSEKETERSREELRNLAEHLQQIREADRMHVAREAHDQMGQSLSAVMIDLARLKDRLQKKETGLKVQVQNVEKQIVNAMESIREICRELRPPVFDDFGLSTAIKWHLREFQKRTGIHCNAAIDENIPAHEKGLDLVLFRILQEATTNILRHAGATRIRVTLTKNAKNIVLHVKDNGRGITARQITDPLSLRILGIYERVRFWGGKSSFVGSPGKGTTMIVSIPISGISALRKGKQEEVSSDAANIIKRGSHGTRIYR